MNEWVRVKDGLPKKKGRYLVIVKNSNVVIVKDFTINLNAIDELDFPAHEYGRPGFYDFDNAIGYYEVLNIEFWCELPKLPSRN